MSTRPRRWWDGAVIYQIYPRSFADADGDGVGDLAGIRQRLPHIADLGVDAIWLSPFFRSPMADFGYDVSDHCDVDPHFGTLADFDALLDDAHRAGIRVLVDYVPNHTSDRHVWFLESRSSRLSAKRDWYVWKDPAPDGGPPNNWRAAFTGEEAWVRDDDNQLRPRWGVATDDAAEASAWTWDADTGQYYLHTFLPEQPDLNWHNPEVVEAMHDVARFWLDRGVDGFRVDAISTVGKPTDFADAPAAMAAIPGGAYDRTDLVSDCIRGLRLVSDAYPGDRLLLGEVGGIRLDELMRHVAYDEFHLAFDFPPMYDKWRASRWRRHIDAAESYHAEHPGKTITWVLSNHDQHRHAERYGSEGRARAAAVLLLTLPGTAVLYAGEELGLLDAVVPPERVVDPGGRDGERAPIPWTDDPDHGWGARPWLPFPKNAHTNNAERLGADPDGILALYRALLGMRRGSEALRHGAFHWLDTPDGVLGWRRDGADDPRYVLVNFSATTVAVPVTDGMGPVLVSTRADSAGCAFAGSLGPDEAIVGEWVP